MKLLVHNKRIQHYAAIKVHNDNVWFFDSLRKQPSVNTADWLMAVLVDKNTFMFTLTDQPTGEDPVSDLISSNIVCYM